MAEDDVFRLETGENLEFVNGSSGTTIIVAGFHDYAIYSYYNDIASSQSIGKHIYI